MKLWQAFTFEFLNWNVFPLAVIEKVSFQFIECYDYSLMESLFSPLNWHKRFYEMFVNVRKSQLHCDVPFCHWDSPSVHLNSCDKLTTYNIKFGDMTFRLVSRIFYICVPFCITVLLYITTNTNFTEKPSNQNYILLNKINSY